MDGEFGGGPEGGAYVGVDVADDGFGGGVAGGEGCSDLVEAFVAVFEVEGEYGARVVDEGAVAGEQAVYAGWGVGEGAEAFEGVQVGAQGTVRVGYDGRAAAEDCVSGEE